MTAENERFATPKSSADRIDKTREEAQRQQIEDAANASKNPPPPPSPAPGEAPAPIVRTAQDVLKAQKELEDSARAAMAKAKLPYQELPVVAELAAPLTASCWNDLPDVGELPAVARWGLFVVFVGGLTATWGMQFVPLFVTPKKDEKKDDQGRDLKDADVLAVK